MSSSASSDTLVKPQVLCIGNQCIDLINIVKTYPEEDSQQKVLKQIVTRGGNGGNTMVVLSQLSAYNLRFMGTLGARDNHCLPITKGLQAHGVDLALCKRYPQYVSPTSYITLNQSSGSRTIITFRELPELAKQDFDKVSDEIIASQDWIHFEGRNVLNVAYMLKRINSLYNPTYSNHPIISVEIERQRPHEVR